MRYGWNSVEYSCLSHSISVSLLSRMISWFMPNSDRWSRPLRLACCLQCIFWALSTQSSQFRKSRHHQWSPPKWVGKVMKTSRIVFVIQIIPSLYNSKRLALLRTRSRGELKGRHALWVFQVVITRTVILSYWFLSSIWLCLPSLFMCLTSCLCIFTSTVALSYFG